MRFLFKTAYEQDIRLFRDGTTAAWYGVLAVIVLALPVLMSRYYIGEITWVFIYGICGVSLMVLVGYTGLVSLGHAAFLGIGAYAHAFFLQHGVPWVASVALAVTDHDGLRHHRRPAGAAHDRHLSRDRDAGIRGDHPGGVHAMGGGDRGLCRHSGRQAGDLRPPLRQRGKLLLSVRGDPGADPGAYAEPLALVHRPRLGCHPRQRDRRAIDGRSPAAATNPWRLPIRRR